MAQCAARQHCNRNAASWAVRITRRSAHILCRGWCLWLMSDGMTARVCHSLNAGLPFRAATWAGRSSLCGADDVCDRTERAVSRTVSVVTVISINKLLFVRRRMLSQSARPPAQWWLASADGTSRLVHSGIFVQLHTAYCSVNLPVPVASYSKSGVFTRCVSQ